MAHRHRPRILSTIELLCWPVGVDRTPAFPFLSFSFQKTDALLRCDLLVRSLSCPIPFRSRATSPLSRLVPVARPCGSASVSIRRLLPFVLRCVSRRGAWLAALAWFLHRRCTLFRCVGFHGRVDGWPSFLPLRCGSLFSSIDPIDRSTPSHPARPPPASRAIPSTCMGRGPCGNGGGVDATLGRDGVVDPTPSHAPQNPNGGVVYRSVPVLWIEARGDRGPRIPTHRSPRRSIARDASNPPPLPLGSGGSFPHVRSRTSFPRGGGEGEDLPLRATSHPTPSSPLPPPPFPIPPSVPRVGPHHVPPPRGGAMETMDPCPSPTKVHHSRPSPF